MQLPSPYNWARYTHLQISSNCWGVHTYTYLQIFPNWYSPSLQPPVGSPNHILILKTVQIETNRWHFGGTFQPKQRDHVVVRVSFRKKWRTKFWCTETRGGSNYGRTQMIWQQDNDDKQESNVYNCWTITMCMMGNGQRFNARPKWGPSTKDWTQKSCCDGQPQVKKWIVGDTWFNAKSNLPPSQLFWILQWNRCKDWGKMVATMGWMQIWSVKLFQKIFIHF